MERCYAILLLLAIAVAAAVFAWAMPRQDRLAEQRAARLVSAEGVVEGGEVRATERGWRRNRRVVYEATVQYAFPVEGATRRGRNVTFHKSEAEFGTRHEADAFLARHAVGSRVAVWYDRANPRDNALESGYIPVTAYAIPALAVCALALGLLVAFTRQLLSQMRRGPLPAPERTKARRAGLATSGAVAVVAAALLAFHAIGWAQHLLRLSRLKEVPVSSVEELELWEEPPTPYVRYLFTGPPGDVFHQGEAWRFGRTRVASSGEALAILDGLRAPERRAAMVVYYDPRDPKTNALSREYGGALRAPEIVSLAGLLALSAVAVLRLRQKKFEGPP